jgi:hypothetical protein
VFNLTLPMKKLTVSRKRKHLEKQIEMLAAGLQKVSAQLEANKPAPQVVAK